LDHSEIVAATLAPPPTRLGVTHWSSRLLGKHLGISFSAVAKAWREYGVQPWRAETFKFSTDPELVAKVTDVVGLYLRGREESDSGVGSHPADVADAAGQARASYP
jgi:hypothetical protein